jgi:hypothetical protein
LLFTFTVFGAVSGILQSYLLLRNGYPGLQWALASCLGFAAGGAAATGVILLAAPVEDISDITIRIITLATMGAVAGGVGAAITGPFFGWTLKHPRTK